MTIEPHIEHVTTDDGVSLACRSFGSGPPIIYQFSAPAFSNFEMELAFPPALATYETIARVATVIRYDFRNTGLSTRGIEDVSIRAHIRDLDAVRRHFRLESAVLVFPFASARIAVEYAAAQPERVTALMLWSPELHRETGLRIQGVADLLQAALRIGPEAYASILAVIVVGLESHANTAWLARYLFESANADDWIRTSAAVDQHDARAAAAKVRAPTLFLYRRLPIYNAGPASAEVIREYRASITRRWRCGLLRVKQAL